MLALFDTLETLLITTVLVAIPLGLTVSGWGAGAAIVLLAAVVLPMPWYLIKSILVVQTLTPLRRDVVLLPILCSFAFRRFILGLAAATVLHLFFQKSGYVTQEMKVWLCAAVVAKFLIPLMAFRSVGDWRIKHFEEKYNYTDSEREFLRDRVLKLYCREWGFVIKPPNPEPASADTASQESRHP